MFINYSKINTSLKEPWNTIISQMTHENPKWGRLSLWPPQLDTGKFLQLTLFLDASAINSRILRAFACSLIEYQKQQRHKKQSIFRSAKLGFEQPFPKARHFFSNLTDLVFVCLLFGVFFVSFCCCCFQILYPMFYNGGMGDGTPEPYTFTPNVVPSFLVESKIRNHFSK